MENNDHSSLAAHDKQVEIWKVKKLVKSLTLARGNGTSMISLVIPPRDQISRIAKMLADEYGTASNIKSRVNRLSVLGAITSMIVVPFKNPHIWHQVRNSASSFTHECH